MHSVGTVFIDLMVGMFFIGLAGSAVVILISFVEDFRELFGSDEPGREPTVVSQPAAAAPLASHAEAR